MIDTKEDKNAEYIDDDIIGWLSKDGSFYPCLFGCHAKELFNHPELKQEDIIYIGTSSIVAECELTQEQRYFFYRNFNRLNSSQKDSLLMKFLLRG